MIKKLIVMILLVMPINCSDIKEEFEAEPEIIMGNIFLQFHVEPHLHNVKISNEINIEEFNKRVDAVLTLATHIGYDAEDDKYYIEFLYK